MTFSFTCLPALLRDESGQDLVEYALIAVLIGLGCVLTMKNLVASIGSVFTAAGTAMNGTV